jgi:hypothetical protein
MQDGSVRFGEAGVNAAIGVRATAVKAAAEPPFGKLRASRTPKWIARGGRVYYDAIWSWLEGLRVGGWAT